MIRLRGGDLEGLDMTGAPLSDEGIASLAHFCPGARTLRLGDCDRLDDRHVIMLSVRCHLLEEVDVSGCRCVHDQYVIGDALL